MVSNIYSWLVLAFSAIFSIALSTVHFSQYQEKNTTLLVQDSLVTLVATLDNNPAFSPVVWRVFRANDKKLIYTSERHSNVTRLPPDRYLVTLDYQGHVINQQLMVRSGITNELIVPLN